MDSWAYIYILNEETEQSHEMATPKQSASGQLLRASDRALPRTATPQREKSSENSCRPEFNHEFEADAYPSYFFL